MEWQKLPDTAGSVDTHVGDGVNGRRLGWFKARCFKWVRCWNVEAVVCKGVDVELADKDLFLNGGKIKEGRENFAVTAKLEVLILGVVNHIKDLVEEIQVLSTKIIKAFLVVANELRPCDEFGFKG
eukprot:324374-Ditylum_brightwellii.AAC.1